MPWYKWNFKTSPTSITYTGDFYGAINIVRNRDYVSKTKTHYKQIIVNNTSLEFVTTNNNTLSISSELSSTKFISNVAVVFYSRDEINSEFFKPLGEAVLNGKYILSKETNLSSNNFFAYDCSCKINGAYTNPLMVYVNGNNFLYTIDTVQCYSYTGYVGTSYIGVPSFPTTSSNDYVLSKTQSSPSGDKTARAQQTLLLYNGNYFNKFEGELFFNNSNVPQYVADFFNNNAILPNTNITVQYKTDIMGNLKSLYEIKSAKFTQSSNKCYLTVTDTFGTSSTLTYDYIQHKDQQLIGLSLDGKTVNIPTNQAEATQIQLKGDITLYEVWQTYRPPTTTFEIKTYNYSGETSRVDKTDYLTPISTLSGVLRGESSLLNFNVLIQSDTVPNFNYCYIDKFKRYYYVTEPVSVRQNLWEMTMQVDALMTYKDSLLKCEGYIDRNEYIQNKMIIDNNRAIMQGADFEEDTITNELFGSGSFVLSGLRIGTKEK